jgi:hypothetical protein
MRLPLAACLVLVMVGCGPNGGEPAAVPEPGVFGIGTSPTVVIGTSDGPLELQFHRAISAHRLADGRIVVSNGGSSELRWFAPDGAFQLAAGRAGQGPGEFRGTPTLFPWPGDSLAAYDPSLERLSLFSASGDQGRVVATGQEFMDAYPWTPWVHRRTVVFGTRVPADHACVAAALAVMPIPPVESGIRFLYLDDVGRLWSRIGNAGQAEWTVWRRDGEPLGRATLPGDFDLFQAGADFALGREAAEDGTERIVRYAITDDRPAGECLPPLVDSLPTVRPAALTRQVRNLLTGQEMAYAIGGSYTSSVDSVGIAPEEGHRFWFYRADRSGWAGAILELASEISCVLSVGNIVPGGWRDGAIICG